MPVPVTPSPIYIPTSALLAPQIEPQLGPSHALPSPSAAILGPLPPTTPLHLALNWLALSDLPEYESTLSAIGGHDRSSEASRRAAGVEEPSSGFGPGRKKRSRPERVLLITGRKDEFYQALQDEDEDWMRDHGSDYNVVERLKRVDVRYCPSPAHLTLLLSLLTSKSSSNDAPVMDGSFSLDSPPGLVILWDMAALLMEWEGADENIVPDDDMGDLMGGMGQMAEPRLRFKKSTKLSDYLDLLAAGRSAVDHFSTTDASRPKTQMILLEPNLDATSSLPVLPPPNPDTVPSTDSFVPSQSRQKRIKLIDGLSWMLGAEAIGVVSEYERSEDDIHSPDFQLVFDANPEQVSYLKRRRCGRGEWARPAFKEGDTEGDHGGWRWEWC